MALKYLTAENYFDEVENSDTPVIIDFYADWCGPCKMMGPVFESLSGEYEGKLKFLKLDTEQEAGVASKFSVQGIPTLLVMKDGKEIGRIVGFVPEDVLKERIDKILSSS